jgi:hypothetical protein
MTLNGDHAVKRFAHDILKRFLSVIKTFRATIIIMTLILIVAYLTSGSTNAQHHKLVGDIGLDLGKVLNWQLWTLPASTVIQSSPGIGLRLALLIVVSLACIEYAAGSFRAVVTFFLSDWISAPLTVLVAWPLAHSGFDRAYNVLYRPDTGSSAAALGALAASFAFLPDRWRIAAYGILFATLAYLIPTPGLSANIAHLLGALVGTGFGVLWLFWKTSIRQTNRALPPVHDALQRLNPPPSRAAHDD